MDKNLGDLVALRAKMLKWAKSMTRGDANAEDLVQTVLLKMISHRHQIPTVGDLDPWVYTVLLNTFRNERIANRRQPLFLDVAEMPLAAVDNPETQTICRQLLGRMDPDDVLDALAIPRESKRDRVLSLSKEAIRVRRFHARQACARVAA